MANTTTENGTTIEITPDGSTNWQLTSDLSQFAQLGGAWIKRITVHPSATSDVFIIRDGGIDNAAVMYVTCADENDDRTIDFNPPKKCDLVIDASDCTFLTAANCRIILDLA